MSFSELPLDSQISLLLNLTPQDLAKYCQSSVEINAVCGSPEFQRGYIIRKFGVPPERLPGITLLEKLRGHQLIIRAHLADPSSPKWEEETIELFDHALRLRSPVVFSRVLEAVRKAYSRRMANYEAERNASDWRISEGTERLKSVYRETFIRALEVGASEELKLLLQYYSPTEDPVMKRYLDQRGSGYPFA